VNRLLRKNSLIYLDRIIIQSVLMLLKMSRLANYIHLTSKGKCISAMM